MAETDEEKRAREEQERKAAEAKKKGAKGDDDPDDDDDDEDDIAKVRADRDKWKGEARKWEGRAKQNSDKAKKYDEIEAKNKTAEERLADLENKGKESSNELLRLRVGMRKGLTEGQIKRLVGKTEEELETDADELLETFKPAGKESEGEGNGNGEGNGRQRVPRERLRPAPRTGARGHEGDDDREPTKEEVKKIVDRSMETRN